MRPIVSGNGQFEPYRPWKPERRAAASAAAKARIALKRRENTVTDDGIREVHGVALSNPLRLVEKDSYITINTSGDSRDLTPAQARYLAEKLYRLANRIEDRRASS